MAASRLEMIPLVQLSRYQWAAIRRGCRLTWRLNLTTPTTRMGRWFTVKKAPDLSTLVMHHISHQAALSAPLHLLKTLMLQQAQGCAAMARKVGQQESTVCDVCGCERFRRIHIDVRQFTRSCMHVVCRYAAWDSESCQETRERIIY